MERKQNVAMPLEVGTVSTEKKWRVLMMQKDIVAMPLEVGTISTDTKGVVIRQITGSQCP
ncbi:hypothetical protein [Persephonella sp.]|uniref:hypothetical protein n=1 Tax=Persephonella sp. TaxID=2060922 RepID=UPI0025E35F65|nr:hypothetical protein [Persephonella sp.]